MGSGRQQHRQAAGGSSRSQRSGRWEAVGSSTGRQQEAVNVEGVYACIYIYVLCAVCCCAIFVVSLFWSYCKVQVGASICV